MSIEIKAPTFPESVADGTVATWHKKPGEAVKRDELIVDIETDKVVLEVVAPADGSIAEIIKGEGETILLLHGEPSWSYLYRKMIPGLAKNQRVIAFDWLGFGRSDKPKNIGDYSFDFHFKSFHHLLDQLQLKEITLVVQDWGGLLGLAMVGQRPDRFKRLIIIKELKTPATSSRKMPAKRLWSIC